MSWTQILAIGGPVLGGGGIGLVKSIGFVPENHAGLKERFNAVVRYKRDFYDCEKRGRRRLVQRFFRLFRLLTWRWRHRHTNCTIIHHAGDPIIYGAGWIWHLPLADKFRTASIRDDFMGMPCHEIILGDRTSFRIKGTSNYRVIRAELYQTLYGVADYKEALTTTWGIKLRELLGSQKYTELADVKSLNDQLTELISKEASNWGLEIHACSILEASPDEHTQAVIQVETRANVLQDNIAKMDGIDPALASVLLGGGAIIASGIGEQRKSVDGKVLTFPSLVGDEKPEA